MRDALRVLSAVVVMMACICLGFALGSLPRNPPPAAGLPEGQVVRVLDVTIRDSNTTGRRQRFDCRPVATPAVKEKM